MTRNECYAGNKKWNAVQYLKNGQNYKLNTKFNLVSENTKLIRLFKCVELQVFTKRLKHDTLSYQNCYCKITHSELCVHFRGTVAILFVILLCVQTLNCFLMYISVLIQVIIARNKF